MKKPLKLYGPRLKLMASPDGSMFSLLLDEFDEVTQESKIFLVEVPRGQLEEWTETFGRVLGQTRPYDGSLCDEPCIKCGHQHCHDHTGRCLSGHPLPRVDEKPPPTCPCPYPHGVQGTMLIRLTPQT
jgi:hypothetical protein